MSDGTPSATSALSVVHRSVNPSESGKIQSTENLRPSLISPFLCPDGLLLSACLRSGRACYWCPDSVCARASETEREREREREGANDRASASQRERTTDRKRRTDRQRERERERPCERGKRTSNSTPEPRAAVGVRAGSLARQRTERLFNTADWLADWFHSGAGRACGAEFNSNKRTNGGTDGRTFK